MDKYQRYIDCKCGKRHDGLLENYEAGKGVISTLPKYLKEYGISRAFVLSDVNTYAVCGERVLQILKDNGIDYTSYTMKDKRVEPDERAVGSVVMHYDNLANGIVAVGSGVINDIGKIIARMTNLPYIVVATAPSMDGYASATSSMAIDGCKFSLQTKCPNVVIGDVDILKTAPDRMLASGLGDMLAKYVSICEWRISNILNGEYYCDSIASVVKGALKKCVDNREGLLRRDEEAIIAVFEGLIISGAGMNYAGSSRPASGVEHYVSHIVDMRGLEFGTPIDFHGIQCGIGTYYAAVLYDKIRNIEPDKTKALKFLESFDYEEHKKELRALLGSSAEKLIENEAKEGKYDLERNKARLCRIIDNIETVKQVINEEMPTAARIGEILDSVSAPKILSEIGTPDYLAPTIFKCTKDVRDKYVLSRLCFDLGIIDEIVK